MRLSFRDLLLFYRMTGKKTSGLRTLVYPVCAYFFSTAFAGKLLEPFIFIPFMLLCLLFYVFFFAVNDFFDYFTEGEKTGVGFLLQEKKVAKRSALFYSLAPAFLSIPLLPAFAPALLPIILYAVAAGYFYSAPPFRLRDKKYRFIITTVSFGFVLPFSMLLALNFFSLEVFSLLLIFTLFQLHCELLHVLADGDEPVKSFGRRKVVAALPVIQVSSILVSALFVFFIHPIFLVTAIFSVSRLLALRRISVKTDFASLRRKVFSPIYSSQELAFYALFGLLAL
jgi:1,4-dihydroxy-2-naphthoate octaprenyltransferase